MARGVLVAALIIVAYLSLRPIGEGGGLPIWDKAQHFLTYGALGLLAAAAFPGRAARGWWLVGLVCYGLLLEGLQAFVPTRFPDFWDGIANGLGVLAAALVAVIAGRRRAADPIDRPGAR